MSRYPPCISALTPSSLCQSLESGVLFFHLLRSRGLRRLESGGARGGVVWMKRTSICILYNQRAFAARHAPLVAISLTRSPQAQPTSRPSPTTPTV